MNTVMTIEQKKAKHREELATAFPSFIDTLHASTLTAHQGIDHYLKYWNCRYSITLPNAVSAALCKGHRIGTVKGRGDAARAIYRYLRATHQVDKPLPTPNYSIAAI